MEIVKQERHGQAVAVIESKEVLIKDVSSALDLLMNAYYETGCIRIVLNKEAVTKDFFVLSTKLAGEVLQKFINYHYKLALYGDFSGYTSKPLRDFMHESNQGHDIFFAADLEDALERITKA